MAAGAVLPSRRRKPSRGIYHQFLWPESCPVSQTRIRNCAVRCDEKPRRAESGPRGVSIRALTQLPQRVWVATARTRTQSRFPAGPPRQKASPAARARRAREPWPRGASGPGKVRETSSLGRREKPRHPAAKAKGNLRGKRSDP